MFEMIVTGKIGTITVLDNDKDWDRWFWLEETYYQKGHGKQVRYYRVFMPNWKSKQSDALIKEGYSIGVIAQNYGIRVRDDIVNLDLIAREVFIL